MNDAPAHHAPCNGTVYAWHYCHYPENNDKNVRVSFGAYEHNNSNDQFTLRPESYYLLQLNFQEDSFTCGSHSHPSEYFQIYNGDKIGACMRRNQNKVLDILAQNAPSSYYVARSKVVQEIVKSMI